MSPVSKLAFSPCDVLSYMLFIKLRMCANLLIDSMSYSIGYVVCGQFSQSLPLPRHAAIGLCKLAQLFM